MYARTSLGNESSNLYILYICVVSVPAAMYAAKMVLVSTSS